MTAKPYKLQVQIWKYFWKTFYTTRSIAGAEEATDLHWRCALPGNYRLVYCGRTLMTWWKK